MKKVAVLMAQGYEESETFLIVEIIRRAGFICDTFSLTSELVHGMHNIVIKSDKFFNDEIQEYDMIVLPGGRPGGENLKNSIEVIEMIRYFNDKNKYIAAMCSGTIVLEEAAVINSKKVTGYTGYEDKLKSGVFSNEVVVFDKNILTSQGPATTYPFAYKIVEILGGNVESLKNEMLYSLAKGK